MIKSKRLAKLRYKSYVLSILLFSIVFYCCIFVLAFSGYKTKLNAAKLYAEGEEYAIASALSRTFSEIDSTRCSIFAEAFGKHYEKRGAYLSVWLNARELFGNLPGEAPLFPERAPVMRIIEVNGTPSILISEALGTDSALIYLRPIGEELRGAYQQMLHLVCFGLCVTLGMAVGLYYLFRRINRPIDNLAHEMRTPLTAIGGFAEYLQTARITDEERYEAAQYIICESARLHDMTERLLTMANLREGDFDTAPVRLETLFSSARKTYPLVTFSDGEHWVRGDAALLQSLVNNLVANARKASPEGAAVELLASSFRVEVRDVGRGMRPDVLKNANNPSASALRAGGGSGLGIPLCHEIARLHHARLYYESEEGKGTRAIVEFTASSQLANAAITSGSYVGEERSDDNL